MIALVRRAVVVAAAVAVLTACSGGDGGGPGGSLGRPSADDIAEAIKDGVSGLGVSPSQPDCAAQLAVASDMSDQAIGRYLPEDHPLYVDADDYAFTEADEQGFDELLAGLKSECGYVQPGG